MNDRHISLLIDYRGGKPLLEPVHVVELADGLFRLLYTPGLVVGIAADDEFRLVGDDGAFEVVRRGGNLAVQVYSREPVAPHRAELVAQVERLGGRLDGAVERGLAFTIPITAGFPAVEALFDAWVAAHSDHEWSYGNVYDPRDGVTPLGWWN